MFIFVFIFLILCLKKSNNKAKQKTPLWNLNRTVAKNSNDDCGIQNSDVLEKRIFTARFVYQ